MSNHVSHASLPYPIKNARYTIPVPFLDSSGTPTDPVTPDTEISKDGGAFADCAEEVTTISGSNGAGYLTLSGAETNCSLLWLCAKVASGPKATLLIDKPRVLPIVTSGTLSAGSASGGTFPIVLPYDVTGCILRTTGGTGGGGTGGANNQARVIITYNTSTGAFTVSPDWETAVSTDTTYDVLLPEGQTLGALKSIAQTGDAFARIGANGAGLTALGDARLANLDAAVSTRLAVASYTAPDNSGISAIGAKTANLPADPAGLAALASAHGAGSWTTATGFSTLDAAGVRAAIGLGAANLDTQLAAIGTLTIAERNAVADALLDRADGIEAGLTLRGCCRLMVAADAGKLSGAGTTTIVIRNAVADSKARITATVDSLGNRSAIVWDVT